ncbi:MAG: glutamate 5-kinase [Magnetococcales bacterium]|nr:glutamate 5-kinase [Magnetococcales bacterium]
MKSPASGFGSKVTGLSNPGDETLESRLRHGWLRARQARRVVIKIGSNLLTGGGSSLRQEWIDARAGEIARLRAQGRQVVVVTSGAVAAGLPKLGLNRSPACLREKQAAAAAGQGLLMRCYAEAFAPHGIHVGQILITRDDVHHRRRYLNARDTLITLLELGLIPVVNENDTVVTLELREFSDNDRLAAMVAGLVEADMLVLLSDVDGLYSKNPRLDPKAHHLPLVERITPEIESLAGGAGSAVGKGGMVTKLAAARMAARSGCHTVLTNGFLDNPVSRIFEGEGHPGTLFLAQGNPISSRKRWIANGLAATGELVLDGGAVLALLAGKSLLAKGIVAVEGGFDRGDAVHCRSPEGRIIAKGLVHYDAEELKRIKGHHSREIRTILGSDAGEEVIHRDDLVVLETFSEGDEILPEA